MIHCSRVQVGRAGCHSGRSEVVEKMKSLILFPLHKTQSDDTYVKH